LGRGLGWGTPGVPANPTTLGFWDSPSVQPPALRRPTSRSPQPGAALPSVGPMEMELLFTLHGGTWGEELWKETARSVMPCTELHVYPLSSSSWSHLQRAAIPRSSPGQTPSPRGTRSWAVTLGYVSLGKKPICQRSRFWVLSVLPCCTGATSLHHSTPAGPKWKNCVYWRWNSGCRSNSLPSPNANPRALQEHKPGLLRALPSASLSRKGDSPVASSGDGKDCSQRQQDRENVQTGRPSCTAWPHISTHLTSSPLFPRSALEPSPPLLPSPTWSLHWTTKPPPPFFPMHNFLFWSRCFHSGATPKKPHNCTGSVRQAGHGSAKLC